MRLGLFAFDSFDARSGAFAGRCVDRGKAAAGLRAIGRLAAGLILSLICACPASAEIRIALWHAGFTRDGPGVLLRDFRRSDPALLALVAQLQEAKPDIVVLTDFDFDARGLALAELAGHLTELTHFLPLASNAGLPMGVDVDGDGRLGEPEDAQAYGQFPGEGASALLSRFPIALEQVQSWNELLWADFQGARFGETEPAFDVQRLSSGGHWVVPVRLPNGARLQMYVGHGMTPAFDGPDDRNGRRNHDELQLWSTILSERVDTDYAVFAVNTNLDPNTGEGDRAAMAAFLSERVFADPLAGLTTAKWPRLPPMRVSYLLPDARLTVVHAQRWPMLEGAAHHLLTVDVTVPTRASP